MREQYDSQQVLELYGRIKDTPAYFGYRINSYWERIMAFIDRNGLGQADFASTLEELDRLNSAMPLPTTSAECERRENIFKTSAKSFADAGGMSLEEFWADFDPEEGLNKPNILDFLHQKNQQLGFSKE